MMAAAALIFFAFYGFDAISTAAEEAKNPGRDLAIGIVGSMVAVHADLHARRRRRDRRASRTALADSRRAAGLYPARDRTIRGAPSLVGWRPSSRCPRVIMVSCMARAASSS
jgi:hypothetical protein